MIACPLRDTFSHSQALRCKDGHPYNSGKRTRSRRGRQRTATHARTQERESDCIEKTTDYKQVIALIQVVVPHIVAHLTTTATTYVTSRAAAAGAATSTTIGHLSIRRGFEGGAGSGANEESCGGGRGGSGRGGDAGRRHETAKPVTGLVLESTGLSIVLSHVPGEVVKVAREGARVVS